MSSQSDLFIGIATTLAGGGVGLLLLFGYLMSRLAVFLSRNWPSVEGRIESSDIRRVVSHSSKGRSSSSYQPTVKYTYTVNGKTYQGNRIDFGIIDGGSRAEAEQAIKPYPAGATCTVYYGPLKPEQSVLERKMVNGGWTLVFIIICLTVGVGGLIYTLRLLGMM